MRLQTKIFLFFGPLLLIVVISLFYLNYFTVQKELRKHAEAELKKFHHSVYLSTEALLNTAITNYLRGITEKNLDIVEFYYDQFKNGNLSEAAAKDSVQKKCNLQKVGKTGYLVAVLEKDSKLYIDIHPYARFQECSNSEACVIWNQKGNGYVEYEWKNPDESKIRKKVAYIKEFKPWNWVFGSTSYKDEFINLIKIDDLKSLIKPLRVNENGYFYLFDENHNILIHPELEGKKGSEVLTKSGKELIPELLKDTDGFVHYDWKNPSEKKYKSKYAYIKKIETFNWYLCASGYFDDINKPLNQFQNINLITIFISAFVLLFLVILFSKQLTTPLKGITDGVNQFFSTKESFNWKNVKVKEIDYLGNSFSKMTHNLHSQMITLNQKIEELNKSHSEKKEMADFLENIINSMPSILIGISPKHIITHWNQNAEKKTGVLKKDAIGQNLFDNFPELKINLYTIDESLKNADVKNFFFKSKLNHHEFLNYETTIYPLANPGKTAAVIRIDNITEKVTLENELNQSRKMEAIGQLAGGVAHDFNNMLTGILSSVENLEEKIRNPHNMKSLDIIKNAALRTRDLTRNLLNFSRQNVNNYSPIHTQKIIESTIHMLKHSISKTTKIIYQHDAKNDIIEGDFSQLQNVLLNLGINSDHAMENEGTLLYKTSNIIENGEELILIEIEDEGSGIPEDIQDKIFNPFFTTKKQGKGTGLGLASVYAVIEQHQGKVSFETEKDKGTLFKIYLPLSDKKIKEEKESITLSDGENFKNLTALVIDDEKIVRETIVTMLETIGINVLSAINGKDGIEKYKASQDNIDIIILDMRMPGMDGPECFKKLKEINSNVKVIISSGYSKEGSVEELEKNGLAGFVSKPYRRAELLKVLSQAI